MLMYTLKTVGAAIAFATAVLSINVAAADQLQAVKDSGKIVFGTEARYPPFEFVEDGKIVGYSADLLDLVMKDLPGVKAERLDLPWQGILSGLETKKFDYVLTSVTATKERADRFALSLPIADASVGIMTRKDDHAIQADKDLNGKIVASQAGSGQLKLLQSFHDEFKKSGSNFEIKEYVDYNEAYSDLAAGRVDAVANSVPNILYAAKLRPELFSVVKNLQVGPKMYFVWVARKDDDSASLATLVNAAIAKANRSGEMSILQKKWFGFEMPVPADSTPQPAL